MHINTKTPFPCLTTTYIHFPQYYGLTHSVDLEKGTTVLILEIDDSDRHYSSQSTKVTFLTPEAVIETRYWETTGDSLNGVVELNNDEDH
jgi:hypothetical protein